MSKELLYRLNGNKNGKLKEYLDSFKDPINIAWYPSGGKDFRPLLYLSRKYSEINPASEEENLFPNFFIYTDYHPWSSPPKFFDTPIIHNDGRTEVIVDYMEELPVLNLPLDAEIVVFPKRSKVTNRVVFLELKVKSNILGDFKYPVIYAFVENEVFCSKILLSNNYSISHIIHIRYGGGCGGGGRASGIWLLYVLKRLGCKVFISDGHYSFQSGDEAALRLYPNLNGKIPKMRVIRTLKSESWSNHGDVTWNLII